MIEFKIVPDKYRKNKEVFLPIRSTEKSAGYDIVYPLNEKAIIKPNEYLFFWTDICIEMPKDIAALIIPRSSTGIVKKLQLSNTIGLIDCDYYGNEQNYGNIGVHLVNRSNNEVEINYKDKLVQVIFTPLYFSVNCNSNIERKGGFGSTNP